MFGSSSAFGQTNSGFGQASTGFGQPAASGATPAFGQTSTPAFGQPATSGASTFGQSTNTGFGQPAASGAPAFGQSTNTGFGQTTNTGFGQTSGATSAFGQTTNTGFGQTSGAASAFGQPAASGISTFGQSSGFGLGSSTGSFGSSTVGQTIPVQKQTTGFGTSMFGQTSTATPQTGFGSFGSSFGTAKTTTGFGTTSGFGSSFGSQAKTTGLGENSQKLNLSASDVAVVKDAFERSGILRAHRTTPTLLEQAVNIQQSFDPDSSSYMFQGFFYNMVHPSQIQNFLPPNNPLPAYQLALESNPEPRCMVPVPAMGYGGLLAKSEIQCQSVQRHHVALNKLQEKIQALNKKQADEVASKLGKIKLAQSKLCQRLTAINKSASLIANHGVPLRPKEETLRRQLETIQAELIKPHQFSILLSQFDNRPLQKDVPVSALSAAEELHGTIIQNDDALADLKTRLDEDLVMANLALAKAVKS